MAIKLPKTYPGTINARFLPDINSVHLSWSSFGNSTLVRQAITDCMEYLEENKLFGWIADTQNCTIPLSQADQDWIEQVAVPRIVKAGCKALFSVITGNLAVRAGNERWEQQIADVGIMIEQFTSLDACIERIRFVKDELAKRKA